MSQKPLPAPTEGVKFPDFSDTEAEAEAEAEALERPKAPDRTGSSQSARSNQSIHPGLAPSVVNVPVTPGITVGEYSPGSTTHLPRPASGYFTANVHRNSESIAQSPSEARSGAKSNEDILRRMSVPSEQEMDPVAANPALGLSGGVISATFCIPHTLEYRKGANWGTSSRRGTSALFDSLSYLSSDNTPWNHTLVGWTGEIKPMEEMTPPDTPPGSNTTGATRIQSLNKSSAPIPVDGTVGDTPPSEGLWIKKEDQTRLEHQLARDKNCKTVPVWLADDNDTISSASDMCLKDQSRWRRFAERRLYTIFHYKQGEPDDGRAERRSWADYYRMNQKFANRILEIYKPGDIVLIHDYHLLLLPSILRQKVPHMYIAFFLHVPFPSSEFLRCLPQRKEILEGVLGANLVGFQSYSYSRHFVSCCTRITGFESDVTGVNAFGAKVMVGVFPIGIDAAVVENLAFDLAIDEKLEALRKLYSGMKLIVGRDRLDTIRGVSQKLMAFERFLEMYPEWREKVVLIQVTSPTSVEEEKEDPDSKIATKVSELVQHINGLYGSLKYLPVQHYPQYLEQEEYFALLRAGDIGLITSVRDGMNTTSLEYILCQRDEHGPLILSEFSGTAGSLRDAIHINPWDLTGVAKQLNAALTMSDEKKSVMHHSLYQHVTTRNVQMWANSFLKRLLAVLSSHTHTVSTPLLDKAALVKQYRDSSKRLFMFDYDGTLTPIVKKPAAAIPSERLIRMLKALSMDERNNIWVISGRDQEFLSRHLGFIKELGFSAEHGSFMRQPGSEEWENLAEKYDMSWQKEVLEVFQKYTEETPGSFIERKRCALTWHYRPCDPDLAQTAARRCQKELLSTVAKSHEVEVMTGKANLEVRPTFINKGSIASRLLSTYGSIPPEFVLCLGDDFTDEDMFRALNSSTLPEEHVFTVAVGASNKMTLARWHLLEPRDVVMAVGLLNGGAGEWKDLGSLAMVEGRLPEELPGTVKMGDEMPEGKL